MIISPSILICQVALLLSMLGTGVVHTSNINLSITNLRNSKGHVLVSVFNSEEGFPEKATAAVRTEKISITNKQATTIFAGLPPGRYAIALLHDENDDMKMNTNFFGIPKEGYGFSNNVMGSFGPPSFSRASFEHLETKTSLVSIRMKY